MRRVVVVVVVVVVVALWFALIYVTGQGTLRGFE